MRRNIKSIIFLYFIMCICFGFSACGTVKEAQAPKKSETIMDKEDASNPVSSKKYDDSENAVCETIPNEVNDTNSYNIIYQENVEKEYTNYGEMEMIHQEFQSSDGSMVFYYDMECFYFDETYPTVLNETLQAYYDAVQEAYIQDSQVYTEPFEGNVNTPYDSLIFQYFTYVDEDYVSLVYNNVCYMGGAHPYSALDGITIDCNTGEIVAVSQFLDDTDKEIGENLQVILGLDSVSMDEWDYYLSETDVVFFYYDPRYWDSVATRRIR